MKNVVVAGSIVVVLVFVWAGLGFTRDDFNYVDGLMDDIDYGIVGSVKFCDVVAVGTVMVLTGVNREDFPKDGIDTICTDVLVSVDTMIKGSPNFGKNHIKFTHEGGTAYIPSQDAVISLEISDGVKFKVGEKVLLLLETSHYPYYARYPYGNMRLMGGSYGKRLIKDDVVEFVYKKDDKFKHMKLPIDLTKELSKASLKNSAASIQLEEQIKSAARGSDNKLTDQVIQQIKTGAKNILKQKETK